MMPSTQQASPVERFHPRVEAKLMVKLLLNGRAILAKARDLSMAGLCLLEDPGIERERLTLAIPLPNDREVVTSAAVRRKSSGGMALEFDQLDWDDMFALARYLHPRLP
ncbi:MAG: PilZ domain-containing protein [Myxococcaceae bacterium]